MGRCLKRSSSPCATAARGGDQLQERAWVSLLLLLHQTEGFAAAASNRRLCCCRRFIETATVSCMCGRVCRNEEQQAMQQACFPHPGEVCWAHLCRTHVKYCTACFDVLACVHMQCDSVVINFFSFFQIFNNCTTAIPCSRCNLLGGPHA